MSFETAHDHAPLHRRSRRARRLFFRRLSLRGLQEPGVAESEDLPHAGQGLKAPAEVWFLSIIRRHKKPRISCEMRGDV